MTHNIADWTCLAMEKLHLVSKDRETWIAIVYAAFKDAPTTPKVKGDGP